MTSTTAFRDYKQACEDIVLAEQQLRDRIKAIDDTKAVKRTILMQQLDRLAAVVQSADFPRIEVDDWVCRRRLREVLCASAEEGELEKKLMGALIGLILMLPVSPSPSPSSSST